MSDMRDIREKPEGREPADVLTFPIRELYTHASEPVETNPEELQGLFEILAEIALAVAERNLTKDKVN